MIFNINSTRGHTGSLLVIYNRRVCLCVCVSVCMCVCVSVTSVCVSFRQYTSSPVVRSGPNLAHTHADLSPNGSELNKNQPVLPKGGLGGFRG